MNLIPIQLDSIQVGHRLPFSLRSSRGALLAQKGFLVESREYLIAMVGSGVELFVDVAESDAQHRAYVGKLYDLVQDDRPHVELFARPVDRLVGADERQVSFRAAERFGVGQARFHVRAVFHGQCLASRARSNEQHSGHKRATRNPFLQHGEAPGQWPWK